MGGGKGSKQKVYDFFMSLDYGVCHGPVDQVNEIVIKDKSALVGPVTANGSVSINQKDLFGGDDGEGGPYGTAEVYMGSYTQKMTAALASRFGLTPDTAPGYRGLLHIFFRGGGRKGFRWTSNNPYMPATKIHATRAARFGPSGNLWPYIWPIVGTNEFGYVTATPGQAFSGGSLDRRKLPDANPAGIIYEALVNADWGKGELDSAVDLDSFVAAAETLNSEHFGLSLKWMREDTIENFIAEILDHIKAVLFEHPATGMWTLKLIRGDYTTDGIHQLTPANAQVQNIKTRLWGETINQIVVSYTDPVSEEQETVSAENPANIAIQGGVKSEERDYHGIRNPWLAMIVAKRDVAEASRTLTSATVMVDRQGFDILPGSVVSFTWPEEEIQDMVCRVVKIDYGNSRDRTVKLEIVEDIFSSPTPYIEAAPQLPEFIEIPPPSDPDRVIVMGVPMPTLIAAGQDPVALDDEYPVVNVMFLAADDDYTPIDIDVHSDIILANGSSQVGSVTTFLPTPNTALGVDLDPEVRSVIPGLVVSEVGELEPAPGNILLIGNSEADHELVMLDSYDDLADEWTVIRGLWDTDPKTWATTDRIWRFDDSFENLDRRGVTAGNDETYFFLPRTETGKLDIGDATPSVYTPSERHHQPFRPANCSIDGNGFTHAAYLSLPLPASITLTWQNRNRLTEDAVAMAWDGGEVTPEVGQTTTIRFRDSLTGTLEYEVTGLTGNSTVVATSNLQNYRYYDVEFLAVRDGIESFRAVTRTMELARFGWGNNYGNDYNENDGA